ncbi:RusA family crossover junction endodeoxyribonuclease [Thalassospira xiamenensis]|uniref:RusA family crossover junction endodeoxyribonuclease n=1 Tax=Thalassospira xiamenensis TaxID=220697 RepID=UPI003AA97E4C
MEIKLPWPPKELNPNARLHHHALARAKAAYKAACGWEMKAQGVKKLSASALHVSLTFYPPDRRHRDLDNMLSSMKAGLDALSAAVGVDDSLWSITIKKAPETGGFVLINVEQKS